MKKRLIFLTTFVLFISLIQVIAFGDVTEKFTAKFEYSQNVFTDINSSEWYADNVKKCYELGLMNGKRTGYFDAGGNVTLAEAIALASRTHEIYNGRDGVFENNGTEWYDSVVSYAANNGIIKVGEFSNYNIPATREQLAYIFSNILPKSEYIVLNNVSRIPDIKVVGPYDSSIYYLYRVGVLTGNDQFGTFNRESYITRSEVATLLIRIVNPEKRVTFSKDAYIYHGNNPKLTKFDFTYKTNFPGETKDLIDINNLKIQSVFMNDGSDPDS